MADDVIQHRQTAPGQAQWPRAVVMAALTVVVVAFAGAGALWAHYGTALFFETIAAGIAACF